MRANRAYLAHMKLLGSKLPSRNTKLKLCKTLIWPILTYGSEACTNNHGRNERPQNIGMEDRRVNLCRRVKEVERWRLKINKAIEVDIIRGRYCEVYKIPTNKMVRSRWKNAKRTRARTNCSSYNGRNKQKRKTMSKMARWVRRGFNPLNAKLNPVYHLLALLGAHLILHVSRIRVKYEGSKTQLGNCKRPSGIEEGCIGSQGPQRTVVFLKQKKK